MYWGLDTCDTINIVCWSFEARLVLTIILPDNAEINARHLSFICHLMPISKTHKLVVHDMTILSIYITLSWYFVHTAANTYHMIRCTVCKGKQRDDKFSSVIWWRYLTLSNYEMPPCGIISQELLNNTTTAVDEDHLLMLIPKHHWSGLCIFSCKMQCCGS